MPVKADPAKELAAAAERAFNRLTPDEQATAAGAFTRLVRLTRADEVGSDTLLLVNLKEFKDEEAEVLKILAGERLVLIEADGANGEGTVRVADDALLQGWERLQQWVNGDREFLLWRQQLKANIAEWEGSKNDKGALLSGEPLRKAWQWQLDREGDLNEAESLYIT